MLFDLDAPEPGQSDLQPDAAPLEVRPGCHLVGRRNPASLLQFNTYVRSFEIGRSSVHVCIDPGSQTDWSVVAANINRLIGDVGGLQSFTCNLDAINPRLKDIIVGRCGYMPSVMRGGVIGPGMSIARIGSGGNT